MKYSLLLIFLIGGVLNSFGQKDFYKEETEITFRFHPLLPSTSETISYYKGKPKKLDFEGMIYFNPSDYIRINKSNQLISDPTYIPSCKFYSEESDLRPLSITANYLRINKLVLESEIQNGEHFCYIPSRQKIEEIYKPFFFKKHEVTNTEYWEFLRSVKESSDTTIPYEELKYKLEFNGTLMDVEIFPDTACWVDDWPYAYNESFSRNYFHHSAFSAHPVVGINFYQAKAFCHWKTIQLQKEMKKKNSSIKIKVDLPNAAEWDWMAINLNKSIFSSPFYLGDNDWMTDLVIDSSYQQKGLNAQLSPSNYFEGALPIDGSFFTHPADLENKKLHKSILKWKRKTPENPSYLDNLDVNNISGLGNNISEWLRDNYADNWSFMFNRQLQLWEEENTPESLLLRQIALYYDSKCDKDGYLVKGGNWYDERFSNVYGKNKAGIHAKTFVAPQKAYSTIGFRYVVHFIE